MDYGIGIAFVFLAVIYFQNKHHREQTDELRRMVDHQFACLRNQFTEIQDLLKWTERS